MNLLSQTPTAPMALVACSGQLFHIDWLRKGCAERVVCELSSPLPASINRPGDQIHARSKHKKRSAFTDLATRL